MCNRDSTHKEKERARTSISTTTIKHQEEERKKLLENKCE
jgi:hypothetical protein